MKRGKKWKYTEQQLFSITRIQNTHTSDSTIFSFLTFIFYQNSGKENFYMCTFRFCFIKPWSIPKSCSGQHFLRAEPLIENRFPLSITTLTNTQRRAYTSISCLNSFHSYKNTQKEPKNADILTNSLRIPC